MYHPNSSISAITARTDLPQNYVSSSVARLRDRGILHTTADPADGRRTLVRVSAETLNTFSRMGAIPADDALAAALGETDPGELTRIIETLESLAARLLPEQPGPPGRQLATSRRRQR